MSQSNHQDYYIARAANSRDLARRAADPAIAAIHTNLAMRYDLLAAAPDQKSVVTLGGLQTT